MNLKEYKRRAVEVVTLPSGLQIKVRRNISQYTFMKICAERGITFDEEGKVAQDKLVELTEGLLRAYIVEPKMPEEWDVEDLLSEDFLFLYERVMSAVSGRERESIRQIAEEQGDF